MGAHGSRHVQVVVDGAGNVGGGGGGYSKKALGRRASTGALLSRLERSQRNSCAVGAEMCLTSEASRIAAARAASSTLSSASSLGCLLSQSERCCTTLPGSTRTMATEGEADVSLYASETTHLPVTSRTGSREDPQQQKQKTVLYKRNSKSLGIARLAQPLKKLARRSTKGSSRNADGGVANSASSLSTIDGREVTEAVSTEYLSLSHRDEAVIEDGDLGDTSSTVEWNGTTLRKSWFQDSSDNTNNTSNRPRAGSNVNISNVGAGAAGSVATTSGRASSRAESVHDVQNRSASLSSRQCRRTASVGSLLSTSGAVGPSANVNCSSTDELISTASSVLSTLSLSSNCGGGAAVGGVRQRCSSQASQAFSTATNASRRSSSSSLATGHNTLLSHSRQQAARDQSAFTPQSQVSASFAAAAGIPGRSASRSQSRGSSGSTGRFSSPSCSPPLTRAPTKLELLLGFSRGAVARCGPGVGARYEDVELWVRGTDRALIKSGWQEQAFLCTGNMVLVYGIFLVAMQKETVRSVADLRGVVLTCLYIAFTYGGHEISYPLKPFLYTTDRQLFWDRCMRIALSSSALMLQINRQETLYHDLLISLHDELYTG